MKIQVAKPAAIERRRLLSRREFLRALPLVPGVVSVLSGATAADSRLFLGWNHPWIAYGHDFGENAWGHDGISTNGWTFETFRDSQGFFDTQVVRGIACSGGGSLRISADLAGGHPNRSSGEVHLVLGDHPAALCPRAGVPYLNLDGITARCTILLPPGSAGPAAAPNGVQFLFKTRLSDEQWPSLYTAWQNIGPAWEGKCVSLVAQVTRAGAAHVDPGFDPTQVSLIGLKVGISSASLASLTGPIYLDDYVLETTPLITFDFEELELYTQFKEIQDITSGSFPIARVFVFADGRASPEFTATGHVTALDGSFFRDFDALVEAAARTNVLLVPVLLDFNWCSQQKIVSGVPLGGHADVIRDADKRQSFLAILTQLLQRYGKHPAVVAWDIINEPEWVITEVPEKIPDFRADFVPLADMQEFVKACADLVHRFTDDFVTLGSARRKWLQLWRGLGLDFYQFHWYDHFSSDEPFPWPPAWLLGLDRPVVIGEVPVQNTRYSPEEFIAAAAAGGYAALLFWSCRARDEFSGF